MRCPLCFYTGGGSTSWAAPVIFRFQHTGMILSILSFFMYDEVMLHAPI